MSQNNESGETVTAGSVCSAGLGAMPTIVSDEEIEKAFTGTNFGDRKPRVLLGLAVLKTLTGYFSGHTITTIMKKLGLIDRRGKVTKKGKDFCLWEFYGNGSDSA